ncbi:MAG: hypothetical protein HLUCCA12_14585 [Rhodobacteraceae bacterium HLUCCA12]|nr:MAG: hypothetical protein HLUCCA12_14585 [Rhodobacteraceae bacterium HLUCCA12]
MNDSDLNPSIVKTARGDAPAERRCLRCSAVFWSEGFGERICKRCKAQAAWKSAIPSANSGSGRRSAR